MVALTPAYGRRLFGADAVNYDRARPGYPEALYEVLRTRCKLKPGTRTFEIGPGTGQATRALLKNGAAPLVAIEPDARLAAALVERSPDVTILDKTFEDAALEPESFDLGCVATAFHWMDQRPALRKVAATLVPNGWWAMWWNVFGDPDRHDPFHEATQELLQGLRDTPSWSPVWKHPFALNKAARLGDLEAVRLFKNCDYHRFDWTLVLTPTEVRALYNTYSQFAVLDDETRQRLLDGLERIATNEFGGRVERQMVTALYIGQKIAPPRRLTR